MRQLTVSQKKILDKFVKDCTVPTEQRWSDYPFKAPNGKREYCLQADNLPNDIWVKLIKINDTEILTQEVDRYLSDKCIKTERAQRGL